MFLVAEVAAQNFVLYVGHLGRRELVVQLPTLEIVAGLVLEKEKLGQSVGPQPKRVALVVEGISGLSHTILEALSREPSGLTVLLSGLRNGFSDAALVDSLRKELVAQGVVPPQVEVRRVEAIPRTALGKAPLIKANVPHLR